MGILTQKHFLSDFLGSTWGQLHRIHIDRCIINRAVAVTVYIAIWLQHFNKFPFIMISSIVYCRDYLVIFIQIWSVQIAYTIWTKLLTVLSLLHEWIFDEIVITASSFNCFHTRMWIYNILRWFLWSFAPEMTYLEVFELGWGHSGQTPSSSSPAWLRRGQTMWEPTSSWTLVPCQPSLVSSLGSASLQICMFPPQTWNTTVVFLIIYTFIQAVIPKVKYNHQVCIHHWRIL